MYQMMWMGSGMASMMFPGVQQYISGMGMGMGMGMGHASVPAIHGAVQLPRVPFVNQSVATASGTNQTSFFPSPAMNAVNFPNQMQNIHLPESYARYLGMPIMPSHQVCRVDCIRFFDVLAILAFADGFDIMIAFQATNFCTYGSQPVQQNQSAGAPGGSLRPGAGGPNCASTENNRSDNFCHGLIAEWVLRESGAVAFSLLLSTDGLLKPRICSILHTKVGQQIENPGINRRSSHLLPILGTRVVLERKD
ncbi:hypothetical protein C4D60_Mb04t38400 [Musa balbisiana]|uniref:Uncharacterized protein n=1 Tax=Musa balbisiana TaxID=52838 RepID=A0A4S8KHP4_MUSBA|nr:hypothetical protein C4D60_Mb04t38400 [Musa balbisiana]